MKVIMVTSASLLLTVVSGDASARDITLLDQTGKAVAYIDTRSQSTIYLWNGTPVAYRKGSSIYGFNGRHLGWLEDGLLLDHDGNRVGYTRRTSDYSPHLATPVEPIKQARKPSPTRVPGESEPIKPFESGDWSDDPLELFLSRGVD